MNDTIPTVVGLDLSLTSTGVAIVRPDAEIRTLVIESKGKDSDNLYVTAERLARIAQEVTALIPYGAVVGIEGPSHGNTNGKHHDRSGLWWLVVHELIYTRNIPVVEISPNTIKKYATGKGTASKLDVVLAIGRRFPEITLAKDDEIDALAIAAILRRRLGLPLEGTLPKVNIAAVDGITIPPIH